MGKGRWKRGDYAGAAQQWSTNYGNAGAALKAGVAAPKRDPTQAAIAQQNALVSGFNAAVQNGSWAQGLQRAGLAGWQQGMNAYAAQGLAAKAQKGQARVLAFAQSYGPQVMGQVQSLQPRGPAGTNQQRSADLNNWQHQQRGKFRHVWRGGAGV